MRKAISNHEQTEYIRNRWEFSTRQGVYYGYTDIFGDYVVVHWSTTIAIFYADGTVWLNPRDYSVTTSAYKQRIRAAMTPDERIAADARNARDMHAAALDWEARYGAESARREFYGNKHWRDLLARFDYALNYA